MSNLDDISWRAGETGVRGKGGRYDVLPLPADVGAAIADWLRAVDPATEIPPRGVFPSYGRRPAPFIFTDDDIARMHAACGSLRPWFRSATYTALFGLIAATGVRVGEALAIPVGGIDLDAGLLPVHPAKSRCERILPLHPTTVAALAEYEELRARKHPKATTFFVSIPPAGQPAGRQPGHDHRLP